MEISDGGQPLFGIAYREKYDVTSYQLPEVKCVEIVAEHFMPLTRWRQRVLERLAEQAPVLVHCLSLSLASAEPPPSWYTSALREIVRIVEAPLVSDHLAVTRYEGRLLPHFVPVEISKDTADRIRHQGTRMAEELQTQIALETIAMPSWAAAQSSAEMPFADFCTHLARDTGLTFLLDISNVYVNCDGNAGETREVANRLLSSVPVSQLHVAGNRVVNGRLRDTHDCAVPRDVIDIVGETLATHDVRYVILERDRELPPFEELIRELERISTRGTSEDVSCES